MITRMAFLFVACAMFLCGCGTYATPDGGGRDISASFFPFGSNEQIKDVPCTGDSDADVAATDEVDQSEAGE